MIGSPAHWALAFAGAAMVAAAMVAATPAASATLTLKRVVLSSGGVGYFEYEAPVEGDATVTLDVPLDQVDDVLKSLVVYDSGGSVGEVTLPGREPLAQSFADLPFDPAVLNSAADLLNALQGSEIRVVGPRSLGGRLVHVDQETVSGPGGVAETRARVSVMTLAGLQQVVLQDVEAIAFADPELAAAGRHRAGADRGLSHIGPAAAQRAHARQRVAHAAARLCRRDAAVEGVVPAQPAGRRGGQNAGENGPAAGLGGAREFQRPALAGCRADPAVRQPGDVPPGSLRKLLREAADGAGRIGRPDTAAARHRHRGGDVAGRAPGQERGRCPVATACLPSARPARGAGRRRCPPPPPPPPPPAPMAPIDAAQVSEQPTQVAFTAPYKVTVAAGQSLMLPLLDRELPARRVDLFQPAVNASHPLAAIEMTNDSGGGLPPGRPDALSAEPRQRRASISATRGSRHFPPATSGW